MKKNQKAFDLETFLSTVNGGRREITYRKGETVFAQGDRCEGVFYIQSGECKVCVTSEQGKEAVVALHGKGDSLAKVVSPASVYGSQPWLP